MDPSLKTPSVSIATVSMIPMSQPIVPVPHVG